LDGEGEAARDFDLPLGRGDFGRGGGFSTSWWNEKTGWGGEGTGCEDCFAGSTVKEGKAKETRRRSVWGSVEGWE